MNRIYLAGQVTGLTYEDGQNWRAYAKERLLEEGIEAFSPLRGKEFLRDYGILEGSYEHNPLSTQKGLFTRDLFDCRNCDVLLVNLLGSDRVSIGTVFEIATCFSLNKPIVLIMEKGGIHTHPFILESCSYIVDNLEDGIDIIKIMLNA